MSRRQKYQGYPSSTASLHFQSCSQQRSSSTFCSEGTGWVVVLHHRCQKQVMAVCRQQLCCGSWPGIRKLQSSLHCFICTWSFRGSLLPLAFSVSIQGIHLRKVLPHINLLPLTFLLPPFLRPLTNKLIIHSSILQPWKSASKESGSNQIWRGIMVLNPFRSFL